MSDKVDFLGDNEPLSLPYFKLYMYLSHNCLIYQAVSFRLPVSAMAEWLQRSERVVYRRIAELEDAGLIKVRHHGDMVVELPAIQIAQLEAKGLAIESDISKREEAFERDIEASIRIVEDTLGRSLSMRERETYARMLIKKRLETRV